MARYDVHRDQDNDFLLLDCQADLLSYLSTRFVVPLLRSNAVPQACNINPVFVVNGESYLMATHLAAAMPSRDLTPAVASLKDEHDTIMRALDVLLAGV